MLGAIILTIIFAIALILGGLGVFFLAFMAEAMSPIPGQAKSKGFAIAGGVMFVIGVLLLATAIWPTAADAHTLAGTFAAVAV